MECFVWKCPFCFKTGGFLLCVVLLCKLLFELNTLQTDQFSCYSSKQALEMSEVTAPVSALGSNVFSATWDVAGGSWVQSQLQNLGLDKNPTESIWRVMGKALLCICSWQDSLQGFLWGLFAAFPDQTLLSGVVSLLLSFACIAETLVSVIWAKLNTRIFQSVKYDQCFREREIKGKYILCLIITYKWYSLSWDVLQRWRKEALTKFLYSSIP